MRGGGEGRMGVGRAVGGDVFFFQAEDGIRDHCVTGVQTCALPIWRHLFVLDVEVICLFNNYFLNF